jgi:hypothetical protein
MLREVNRHFEQEGWSDQAYTRYLQQGLVPALQAAGRSALENPIPTFPAWAQDEVRRLSEERIQAIRDSGVNVVGDLETLLPPDVVDPPAEVPEVETLSLATAATAVAAVVGAAVRREEELRSRVAKARRARPAAADRVSETSSKDLLREVLRRQRRRLPPR